MKAGKSKKIWICVALALVMGATLALSQSEAFAGDRIDTSARCSLEITMAGDVEAQYPELMSAEIPVTLYKVADVDSNAKYTPLAGFEEIGLDAIDSNTTAADWAEIAGKACQALGLPYGIEEDPEAAAGEETGKAPAVTDPVKSTFTVVPGDGVEDKLTDMDCGLYLVYAQETPTDNYVYSFTPYLVSLPTSDYMIEGGGTDTWTYDVIMGLKPGQDTFRGRLIIEKTLNTVNVSMGGATCVFRVEAVKNGKTVYSNVLSLNFMEPGTKQIVIDEIPMGASVTVTEIYAGAGYELISEPSLQTTIVKPETPGYPATVNFTNDYEYPGYGTSVVNHFERIGEGWEWNQQTDHAGSIGEE